VATGKVYLAKSGMNSVLSRINGRDFGRRGKFRMAGSRLWTHFFNYLSLSSSALSSFGLDLPCFSASKNRGVELEAEAAE
jgi:hypothetical protein